MEKYVYSGSLVNTLYIEVKHKSPLGKINRTETDLN